MQAVFVRYNRRGMDRTLTEGDSRMARRAPGTQPCLFRVLMCERLAEPPSRHALGHVVSVEIGRSAERTQARVERRLTLGIPDPRASGRHALVSRVLDGWMIEDAGSRNGTSVNGARVERAVLHDGDLIEIGRTFFVFRDEQPVGHGPPDADAAAALPGLATLLPSLAEAYDGLVEVARARLPVLVQGESGTGKELVARAVHALAGKSGDFVAVNCGALPATLVESELFGAQKGAFSGADRDRPGLVRAANGGTLFLDEIGELPHAAQVALLRVLQEREVTPVGGTRPVRVDFGLVTATHRDLPAQIAAGRFRADLFARIAGHRIAVPPLRERREDLGLLVAALLGRAGRGELTLSVDAARALLGLRSLPSASATRVTLPRCSVRSCTS